MNQTCDNCIYCHSGDCLDIDGIEIDQKINIYCTLLKEIFPKKHTCTEHVFRMIFEEVLTTKEND